MHVRRTLLTVAALIAGLALADLAVWWVATNRLISAYLFWQSDLDSRHWHASADPPRRTGWPLAARVQLDHPRLDSNDTAGWSGERAEFGVSLFSPTKLTIELIGDQALSLPGLAPISFNAGTLQVRAPLASPIRALQLTARALAIHTATGPAIVARLSATADWSQENAALRVQAGPIALPPGRTWPLGPRVGGAALTLIGHGAWTGGGSAQAAQSWRDAGGVLDIQTATLQWAQLQATATGHATLDAALQPQAHLDVQISDPHAALTTMAETGAISRGTAIAAGAILTLLELPARLAGQNLTLPLTLQDGSVGLGQIPLLRVPAISWK